MRPLSGRRETAPPAQRQNRRPSPQGHDHPRTPLGSEGDRPEPQRSSAPWHFWLVVVMATVYLGWRAVEGVVWLIQWIA